MARNREKEKQDKKGEQIAHQFLLEHFYTQTDLYHECVTKEEQLKGYDTTFTVKSQHLLMILHFSQSIFKPHTHHIVC